MIKKNKIKSVILIAILIIIFFIGLFLTLNDKMSFTLLSFKDVLYYPFLDISNNKMDIVGNSINIELVEENEDLKNISGIQSSLVDFQNISATVIERNQSYWLDTLTLNKGKSSGIDIGMAVVVGEGLVGKIINISNNTSIVRLITSNNNVNKVSIKYKDNGKYVNKVLENEKNNLIIAGIDNNNKIKLGTDVVTSGFSDIYPSGIFIGTITKIVDDNYNSSKIAYVESKVNFDSLRFVTVLKRNI